MLSRVTRNCQSWREPRRVGPGKQFLEIKKQDFDFDLEKNSFGPEPKNIFRTWKTRNRI